MSAKRKPRSSSAKHQPAAAAASSRSSSAAARSTKPSSKSRIVSSSDDDESRPEFLDASGVPLTDTEILHSMTEQQLRAEMAVKQFRSMKGWPRVYYSFKRNTNELHKEEPRTWDKEAAANCNTCWNCPDKGDPEVLCCDGICRRSFHLGCVGLDEVPETAWFCPQCAEAEFPEPGCNDNDPVGRSVLLCAIEDHKLRDDEDDPKAPKHAYLTYLLNEPRLERKLNVNLCDKERGFNALHYSMIKHNQCPSDEVVRLVELGCDVNRPASLNPIDLHATPAHMALQQQETSLFLPLLTSSIINLKARSGGSGLFIKKNPLNGDAGRQFKATTYPIFYAFSLIFVLREHLLLRKRSPSADPTAVLTEAQSEASLGYSFPAFVREKLRVLDMRPLQFAYLMLLTPREGKTITLQMFTLQAFRLRVTHALESDRNQQARTACRAGFPPLAPEPIVNPFEGVSQKALHGRLVDELMALVEEQHQRQQRFAAVETKLRVRMGVGTYARWTRAWEHLHGRPAPDSADVAVKLEPQSKATKRANSSSSAAAVAAAAAAAASAASASDEEEGEVQSEDEEEEPLEERKQADSPHPRQRKPLPSASNRSARGREQIELPPSRSSSGHASDDLDADGSLKVDEDAHMQPMLSPVPPQPVYSPVVPPSPQPGVGHSRKRRANGVISESPELPVLVASTAARSVSSSSASKRSKFASPSSLPPPILPHLQVVSSASAVAPMRMSSDASSEPIRAEEKSAQATPSFSNPTTALPAMIAAATHASAAYLACIPTLIEQTLEYRRLLTRGIRNDADTAAISSALSSDVGASASRALDALIKLRQQHADARQQLQQTFSNAQRGAGANAADARRWGDSDQSVLSLPSTR